MKTKILGLFTLLLVVSFSLTAKEKTEKFPVKGECGMCEKRIEMSALSVNGVSKADWDKETKKMEVVFDDSKTDVHKVEMAIAKVGHDTKMHKADDKTYNELPGCCKYDRSFLEEQKENVKHKHK